MKLHPLRFLVLLAIAGFVLYEVVTWYACVVSDTTMQRVLGEEGYSDIELGTYAWDGCPKGDMFRRGFRASRSGRVVEGAVCCSGTFVHLCDVRH